MRLPPSDPLLDVSAARDIALAQVAPLGDGATVPLAEALGRVASREVRAEAAMPFFTNSAMDGFAVRGASGDAGPRRLPIMATIAAGTVPDALPPGAAARIFTGAPLPEGADAVVPVEDAVEQDGHLLLSTLPEPGANVRLAGSDQPAGGLLLPCGTRIAPHHLGLLAANGVERVAVARLPRVAVLSTGDEVVQGPRGSGQIHDSNRPMLLALARAAGAEAVDAGLLPDDPDATAGRLLDLAAEADLVLTSGAVSMGGRDHLRPAFAAAGGEVAAWRVAVKPGKPIMLGRLGRAAVTGLPGNPFAAFVGFHLFAAPQIARLSGGAPRPFAPWKARAAFSWRRRPGRAEVFPVRCLGPDDAGLPRLDRLGAGVSATLFPLAETDGLAILPAHAEEVAPGQMLDWRPFRPI